MKNLKSLSALELRTINGGCQIGDCGQGPIIVIKPTTGPTYPDPTPFGDPVEWNINFSG